MRPKWTHFLRARSSRRKCTYEYKDVARFLLIAAVSIVVLGLILATLSASSSSATSASSSYLMGISASLWRGCVHRGASHCQTDGWTGSKTLSYPVSRRIFLMLIFKTHHLLSTYGTVRAGKIAFVPTHRPLSKSG